MDEQQRQQQRERDRSLFCFCFSLVFVVSLRCVSIVNRDDFYALKLDECEPCERWWWQIWREYTVWDAWCVQTHTFAALSMTTATTSPTDNWTHLQYVPLMNNWTSTGRKRIKRINLCVRSTTCMHTLRICASAGQSNEAMKRGERIQYYAFGFIC